MRIEVDIDLDDLDAVVRESLREAYFYNLAPNKIDNSDEVIEPDYEFLKAVDLVLRYYQNAAEQAEWDAMKPSV